MNWRNTQAHFGFVSLFLHWAMALCIICLFALGWWMDGLDYYSRWYQLAPHVHKSIGVIIVILMVFRLVWRLTSAFPKPLRSHSMLEKRLALLAQSAFYIFVFLLFITGYLITTAKGLGLDVFNWFTLPAVLDSIDGLENIAGDVHKYLAYTLMGFVVLHAIAAMKHHYIDRDVTLLRMLGKNKR